MCIAEDLNSENPDKTTPDILREELSRFQGKTKRTPRNTPNIVLLHIENNSGDNEDNHSSHPPSPQWRWIIGLMLLGAFTLSSATATSQSLRWGSSKSHHDLSSSSSSMWTVLTDAAVSTEDEELKSSPNSDMDVSSSTNEAICVPGGGFSGFWFTMGQLQSIKMPSLSHDYYCYSAGCLCVVAYLADLSVHQMLNAALEASDLWRAGKISRFEVVPYFVDEMIQMILARQDDEEDKDKDDGRCLATGRCTATGSPHPNSTTHVELRMRNRRRPDWLNNLRIITGARRESGWGLDTSVRVPISSSNNDNVGNDESDWTLILRKMLLQTVWIPGMVGDALFLEDHIDGGFVARHIWHKCDHTIEAVWNWELLSTCFDTNLSKEQALYFWEAGSAHTASIGLPS